MRKLLLILLLFISSVTFSQNYQGYVPFPTDSGTTWNSLEGCYEGTYEIRGDTLINSITYHKLRHYGKRYNTDWRGCGRTGYTLFDRYIGSFRNDSINKKVYIILADSTADSLFYDFDINVGDTLTHSLKFNSFMSNADAVVLYEDTVEYGGVWRKKFTIFGQCIGSFTDTIHLIEGIGSTESFYSPTVLCPFEYGATLECMQINNQTIYPDSSTTCQPVITSIKENTLSKKVFFLSPNPTNGIIKLQTQTQVQSIEVYNLQGQKVQEISPKNRTLELPEKSGLYLIRIQDEEGRVFTEKIIKN